MMRFHFWANYPFKALQIKCYDIIASVCGHHSGSWKRPLRPQQFYNILLYLLNWGVKWSQNSSTMTLNEMVLSPSFNESVFASTCVEHQWICGHWYIPFWRSKLHGTRLYKQKCNCSIYTLHVLILFWVTHFLSSWSIIFFLIFILFWPNRNLESWLNSAELSPRSHSTSPLFLKQLQFFSNTPRSLMTEGSILTLTMINLRAYVPQNSAWIHKNVFTVRDNCGWHSPTLCRAGPLFSRLLARARRGAACALPYERTNWKWSVSWLCWVMSMLALLGAAN